ncbi:MAG: hypothetical protein A2144_04115 [Chloroflexi bacterium RBG_16_50_9]|nr:MAG: hypothetical protein A2144_04115 [Chloroflexi bacterium RBG_16_50_9]
MKRILVITLIVLVLSFLVDLPLHGGHGDFAWSNISGFFALFGLIGCVAIVLISKWLGHHWLQRKEDYYDRKGDDK